MHTIESFPESRSNAISKILPHLGYKVRYPLHPHVSVLPVKDHIRKVIVLALMDKGSDNICLLTMSCQCDWSMTKTFEGAIRVLKEQLQSRSTSYAAYELLVRTRVSEQINPVTLTINMPHRRPSEVQKCEGLHSSRKPHTQVVPPDVSGFSILVPKVRGNVLSIHSDNGETRPA